jgi:REP element-mobilizing transposase RayT
MEDGSSESALRGETLNTNGGQECPLPCYSKSGESMEDGSSESALRVETLNTNGGQECPPPFEYLDPEKEIEMRQHRLPHWQQGDVWVFVTWRLADSLPKAKLDVWQEERAIWLIQHPEPWNDKTEADYHERFSGKIDEWLDLGSGSCLLNDPANSQIVETALRRFDGERYRLASFVVMPNHVHVLFRPFQGQSLADIMKSWKGFTAREINKRSGKSGSLWQEEYWDRLIRNEQHYFKVDEYIRLNPSKARL